VPINDAIQPSLLKSVLLSEFNRRNIRETFEFSIYDCSNEKIVFGSYISQNDQALINSEFPDITKDDYYFSVLFPNISFQLINEMSIWLSSSFILLLIVSVFVYTVVALFRQKKLADFQRDFINNMAHEFKTPLAAIGASSEMMLHEEMESNRRKQHICLINKETVRLTHQVDQFLQISKLDKASPELNITSINDNGKGILKADRNFIFDKFYRISTGDIHDVKGFGLGLYYVKMMTKLLGGDIHLERSDDSGSTFVLEINDYEK
jgi:two-component system phosphate regulon sensor histidine kinase PhoR